MKEGIIIDLAHLNKKSFYQVAGCGQKLFCSHTCFDEVCSHKRNLDKKQIQTIVDSGGLVGLTLVGDFLGGRELENVYNHIDYFIKNFGADNLAIGTDFYGTEQLPYELEQYKDFAKLELPQTTLNKIFHKNYYDFQKTCKQN